MADVVADAVVLQIAARMDGFERELKRALNQSQQANPFTVTASVSFPGHKHDFAVTTKI